RRSTGACWNVSDGRADETACGALQVGMRHYCTPRTALASALAAALVAFSMRAHDANGRAAHDDRRHGRDDGVERGGGADVEGRYGLAAHGAADQSHDDHRRLDVRRPSRLKTAEGAHRRTLPRVPPFSPARRAVAERRVVGDR